MLIDGTPIAVLEGPVCPACAKAGVLLNGQLTPCGQVNAQFTGVKAITGLTPAGSLTSDLGILLKQCGFDFSLAPPCGYPRVPGHDFRTDQHPARLLLRRCRQDSGQRL